MCLEEERWGITAALPTPCHVCAHFSFSHVVHPGAKWRPGKGKDEAANFYASALDAAGSVQHDEREQSESGCDALSGVTNAKWCEEGVMVPGLGCASAVLLKIGRAAVGRGEGPLF